jgi:hypothetical protein
MRLAAYMTQHGLPADALDGLRVVNANLDLRKPNADLRPLIEQLRIAASELGGVSVVVLDTLNSMMGAGDENESADMGAMIQSARAIMVALECSAIYIHHSGKDEDRGARGHSSLRAACDTEIRVRGTTFERLATVTKQRDGETGLELAFGLNIVDLGPSIDPDAEDDERDTSCACVPLTTVDVSALKSDTTAKPLTKHASTLLRLVEQGPRPLTSVRTDFYEKLGDMASDSKKHAYRNAFNALVARELIDRNESDVWLAIKPEGGT